MPNPYPVQIIELHVQVLDGNVPVLLGQVIVRLVGDVAVEPPFDVDPRGTDLNLATPGLVLAGLPAHVIHDAAANLEGIGAVGVAELEAVLVGDRPGIINRFAGRLCVQFRPRAVLIVGEGEGGEREDHEGADQCDLGFHL